MDLVDIDSTLKELDDLETDLFQNSLKTVSRQKSEDEKAGTPKKQASKALSKEPADVFDDDDDIADLLSDEYDAGFGKPKAAKSASDVASSENQKVGKKPPLSTSGSFDSLDDGIVAKQSPTHFYGEANPDKQAPKSKDLFDRGNYLGISDFEKGSNASGSQRNSVYQHDINSPKKAEHAKEDYGFHSDKSGGRKSEASARTTQPQKKKDEVNFEDSELLDDLGLDDVMAKPSKQKTNPGIYEKKESFIDNLFGDSKKEQSTPSKKQQEFTLDEKYKSSAIKNDDDDAFGFGSYVPSSAASSGPASRRKSVKFDEEPILPRSGTAGSRHKSFTKQSSYLDELLSPVNKSKTDFATGKASASEDSSHYSSPAVAKPHLDNPQTKTASQSVSDMTLSRQRDGNKKWLGFLKDDKEKELQNAPRDKSSELSEKSSSKGRDDVLGQRRRSSGADWLGLGKIQSSDKNEDMNHTTARASVNVPRQQPHDLNAADSKILEPRQVQKQMQNISSVQESSAASLDQLVSSVKMSSSSSGAAKVESFPVIGHQPSATSVNLQGGVISNIPVTESVVPTQSALQHVNANVPSVHQFATVETQNNFMAFQSMISSLQLEKERLLNSIEALKLKHEEEIKAVELSQKNQMKTTEGSFKNQEKRLKEEYEAKVHNLESQVKDLTKEKAEVVSSYKEKMDELKKDHDQEVQRLKDLHSQAILTMKEDHESALARLKQLKDQEIEAISSTQVYARSLQHLTDQLEARASELAALHLKVDERHQKSLQERQTLLDAKDKDLKELKKKLDRQLEESEEERTRLQQLVLRLESRLQQVTKDSEEEKWNMQQSQAKIEIQKKIFDEEHKQAFEKIERDREKLKITQESLLQEQKTVLLQLAHERQQLTSEKMEFDLLSKRLKEDESRLQSARLKHEANIEAERRSLLREKDNLEMERARIRQESHQLQLDREEVERDRRQLQDEKEKLSAQKINLYKRTQEVEDTSRNAKQMKEEAKIALSSANRLGTDHRAQLEQLNHQLSALRAKETEIQIEKSNLVEERKILETKKDSLLCMSCKLLQSRPFSDLTFDSAMQPIPSAFPSSNIRAITGLQNPANVDPNLLWWYITAQKDKEYLTNEQLFLQSLHESSRRKARIQETDT